MSQILPIDQYDFKAGALLLIDKPIGWTSFDVVNKVRYRLKHLLGVKKIKVGHSGTLDPLATGLLIICTGKFTKKLNDLQGLTKEYTGTIHFGATTPSYDKETEEDQQFPVDHIDDALLAKARPQFLGKIQQIPPMFSAIKVNGEALYKKARMGESIEIKARNIEIFDFEYTQFESPDLNFRVSCSKGTYIRSLAYDLGKAVESGAYLTSLCRTKVGDFELKNAWNLEALIAALEQEEARIKASSESESSES